MLLFLAVCAGMCRIHKWAKILYDRDCHYISMNANLLVVMLLLRSEKLTTVRRCRIYIYTIALYNSRHLTIQFSPRLLVNKILVLIWLLISDWKPEGLLPAGA